MKANTLGLYLHVPFCVRKCSYCDFCSFPALSESEKDEYVDAEIREILSYKRADKIPVETVFFGGGTPSLLTPNQLSKIFRAIEKVFLILPNSEITLEANPKTFDCEKMREYAALGVNRVSMGLQSIHENELKILGRIHNFDDFKRAYEIVDSVGISNVNVDLMYAIPEQTPESLLKTLRSVIELSPSHVSAYSLILEEGTPLYNAQKRLSLPSDEQEYEMYLSICNTLGEAGYSHYEISNYARAGCESRHNLKYWQNREYIGVGISAYSYLGDRRYGNTRLLSEYLSPRYESYREVEYVDSATRAFEYAMLGLRLKEGISLSKYRNISGRELSIDKIQAYVDAGYMNLSADRISLTEKGFYVSNSILAELL
ncbi:MAG: radical SAM family heme chaperone HemW [Clostridia bacterium]|nr:radical SAM family heme chaperone HemW [Clostridia bacterium]